MNWPLLTAVLAAAGFVQGTVGFGFGLVSMSLLPLFVGIKQAAVISTIFTLLATVITFARHQRGYNWRLGMVFLASVVIGLPFGVYLLQQGSERALTRLMGGFLLTYVAREFVTRGKSKPLPSTWTVPWGLFSGAMSGAFNLGGVPTAAYAYAQPWERGQIMSFLQVMISSSCILRMVFYGKAGLRGGLSWLQILLLSSALVGALWVGHLATRCLDPKSMRNGIFVFIGATGVYYLFFYRG